MGKTGRAVVADGHGHAMATAGGAKEHSKKARSMDPAEAPAEVVLSANLSR